MKFLLLLCTVYAVQSHWVDEMENKGLYEGDMVLNPEQMAEAKDGKFAFQGVKDRYLWTKNGNTVTIPYDMDSTISRSSKARNAIQKAIEDYHKYTCLRFVPRSGQRAYVHFRDGGGCSSPVGMTGGQNSITLASGCWSRSTVIHEIGHTIGLHHEQSRPDRDSYIKVHWENIPSGIQYNFHKQSTDRVDSRGTPYDYRSVMHYGKTAFGGGKVTMETVDPYYTDLIGVSAGFSDVDVDQINRMYRCPKYNGVVEAVKQTPDCHDSTGYCEMIVWDHGCNDQWTAQRCPFYCKKCTPGGGPVPTQRPNPHTQRPNPDANCKDSASNCKDLLNHCNQHDIRTKWCKKSCNACQGPVITQRPKPDPNCKDTIVNCKDLLEHCNQGNLQQQMRTKWCKKSCNAC